MRDRFHPAGHNNYTQECFSIRLYCILDQPRSNVSTVPGINESCFGYPIDRFHWPRPCHGGAREVGLVILCVLSGSLYARRQQQLTGLLFGNCERSVHQLSYIQESCVIVRSAFSGAYSKALQLIVGGW